MVQMAMTKMTQEKLKSILHYDPETGVFRWVADGKVKTRRKAGMVAGVKMNSGYLDVTIDRERYLLHRLAFMYMGYEMPETVDHVDHNTMNNAWSNLRPASFSQNLWNCKLRSDSTTGVKGVSFNKEKGAYDAYFNAHGKRIRCGRFETLEDAASAVMKAREAHHGEFVCHG